MGEQRVAELWLSRLWSNHDRGEDAYSVLYPVLASVTEGSGHALRPHGTCGLGLDGPPD